MVRTARELGWEVYPSPHLAFFNSGPLVRLYMRPDVDPEVYAKRWEGPDGRLIGQHSADEVRAHIWPALKERGYASSGDDEVLEEFLRILGRRKVHLRPGIRFRRRWQKSEVDRLDQHALARHMRADVNRIPQAAGDPTLPSDL
jgi:hypothetical protein